MPEATDPTGQPFISRELRPDLSLPEDSSPPPAPGASAQDLRKRAAELLGPEQSALLGVGDSIEASKVCTRKPDVTWSAVEGEAVLLDLATGFYFSLNRVGTVMWELMDGKATLGAIHVAVCNRFNVEPATAWEDLLALVRRLHGEKLLTIA